MRRLSNPLYFSLVLLLFFALLDVCLPISRPRSRPTLRPPTEEEDPGGTSRHTTKSSRGGEREVLTALDASSPKRPSKGRSSLPYRKFCLGTENGRNAITVTADHQLNHYGRLKKSYEGCRRIIGNLEITHIHNRDVDNDFTEVRQANGSVTRVKNKPFHFLEHVEEITGYLLIFNVHAKEVTLPSLRIIWGEKQLEGNALHIDSNVALRTLALPSLRSIEEGNVTIKSSPILCYMDPVEGMLDYSEILGDNYANRLHSLTSFSDECSLRKKLKCSSSCAHRSCYGPGADQCQVVYRRMCPACESRSCYLDSKGTSRCCDETCAGGCYGDGKDKCIACKKFEQDGRCVNECVGTHVYNPHTLVKEELPEDRRRYFYGRHCVAECPPGTLYEDKYCVARCSPGFYRDLDKNDQRCVPCVGECPKICQMQEPITALNIGSLVNCSEIEGKIEILNHVFEQYTEVDTKRNLTITVPALQAEDLEVLKSVRVVTDFVLVDGGKRNRSNRPISLEFLENLEMIEGRQLYYEKFSLYIIGNTGLKWLGLRSLKRVKSGLLSFSQNKDLCYGYTIPFITVLKVRNGTWRNNMEASECEATGRRCDASCDSRKGCWGPGPGMCVSCRNFTRDGICASDCPRDSYYVSKRDPKNCIRCHPECKGCRGTGAMDCLHCRHFEHWTRSVIGTTTTANVPPESRRLCVSTCPNTTYTVEGERRCERCNQACYNHGCTGPSAMHGLGGCKKCQYGAEVEEQNGASGGLQCLIGETEEAACGAGNNLTANYFLAFGNPEISKYVGFTEGCSFEKLKLNDGSIPLFLTVQMCQKCLPECRTCTRDSDSVKECDCLSYRLITPPTLDFDDNQTTLLPLDFYHLHHSDRCVPKCGRGSYLLLEQSKEAPIGLCGRCHELCDEKFSCSGPQPTECDRCAKAGIHLNDTLIECLEQCPVETPFVYEGTCHSENKEAIARKRRYVIAGSIISALALFAFVTAYLSYRCTKYRKKYEKEAQMNLPEIPPLDPKQIYDRPNMRRLILLAVDELDSSKNVILGQGAFGVVYAGKWKPPLPYTGKSIPVAIKAISSLEYTSEAEMIKEAGLMCCIQHKHLLPLVGVCVAGGIKIVTLLRPLGCLQKFLDKHKNSLGSKHLMLYSYQIAAAMSFLAKKKIVHRDLAARNVLVKNINHVEVTDFGLAQMLQGQETSVVVQGRVAAKWLAIESLRNQIYNEKTDVWSFGITVWEILTYGTAPYKELQLPRDHKLHRELANQLEKGYRLAQPSNCSQELYQELLNCWLLDAKSRPTFRKLEERFEGFCRAPHIYIQERNATAMRMDSISSSDQRVMIERLLHDNDFLDPDNVDPADYTSHTSAIHQPHGTPHWRSNGMGNGGLFLSATMETLLTPSSPTVSTSPASTPTRPLLSNSGDGRNGSSIGSNSTRYKSDPTAGLRHTRLSSSATTTTNLSSGGSGGDAEIEGEMLAARLARLGSQVETDDENYLKPKCRGKSEDEQLAPAEMDAYNLQPLQSSIDSVARRESEMGKSIISTLYTPIIEEGDEEEEEEEGSQATEKATELEGQINGGSNGYVNRNGGLLDTQTTGEESYANADSPRAKLLVRCDATCFTPPMKRGRRLRFGYDSASATNPDEPPPPYTNEEEKEKENGELPIQNHGVETSI